jgi:nicotinamidase/pyrazinamidase
MIFFDVDTQHDFMHHDGALYVPQAEAIRANIERLLRTAGEKGITTISSRCAHEPGDPEFEIFPPHCLDGTPGAERIFPDLPRLPRYEIDVDTEADLSAEITPATHYIVKKKAFDMFSNPWLEGLRRKGAFEDQECIVFGVATDYCVRACGLALAQTGARVLLVEDAIRGVSVETVEKTIEELSAAGVHFTVTDEILKRLG